MDYVLLAFYLFAGIAVAAAGGVILARNPVHAVLSLVLTFFAVACTWILAGAEFLGIALVLVYVGAVMVLFLFVVMMLDIDAAPRREGFVRYLPVAAIVAVAMLVQVLVLIGVRGKAVTGFAADPAEAQGVSNAVWLARRLYSEYLLPFEIAAVILTVAVVAAVMLALRVRGGTKHQNAGWQARVKASDRLRMVKMDAERPLPAAEPQPAEGEEGKQ
ncbi:MAG: NADH-quinone oxidoreductase subunit J [Pseudoxanthomonas suwonensis]|nr:NADH-quinone oxidoreductase subunit J [Pseudoxanthomonas suwonensis]